MKRLLLLIIILLPSIICSAQKKDRREGDYSAYLYSVDGPEDHNIDSVRSVYEDPLIKIDWDYGYSQIGFELTNKSDQTMKILWDDAAYISMSNESSRVFHKGVKYIDRENSQPPTSVYKNSTLSDLISPTSYTRYVTGQYGGWTSEPLIPVKRVLMSYKVEYNENFIGQVMRVVLPIKIEDSILEYIFSFKTTFVENTNSKRKKKTGDDLYD
ncbi:hypothetical protein DYBT9623_00690 [Dyadobacter sp. CECT 9623]|uniref:Uncharacterized protein n=1 Tax=Dyadobacter linearis TaxID=2823330 RepID=A0ABM8UKK9_9BACT|nr:hypothetical protein [Dyadobacter sp. CECT 9623]CAG5067962.1 hypothetical protein DYBT9623_00690 [Dyadobacter sp. CECT 9623]